MEKPACDVIGCSYSADWRLPIAVDGVSDVCLCSSHYECLRERNARTAGCYVRITEALAMQRDGLRHDTAGMGEAGRSFWRARQPG